MTAMDIDCPALVNEPDHRGNPRLYVRRGRTRLGPQRKIRIRATPGTPEFLEEYRAAYTALFRADAAAQPAPAPARGPASYPERSFGWLVNRYFTECVAFRTMKAAGQRRRRRMLEAMADRHGTKSMMIPSGVIAAGFNDRLDRIEAANAWLKGVKALYAWAVDAGVMKQNPAAAIRKVRRRTDGFHTWSVDELRAFVTRHPPGTRAYLALMLLLFTGLRRNDAHLLGRAHLRDGRIHFRTGKTEALLSCVAARPFLDAVEAAPRHEHLTFLISGWDRPFSSGNAFGNWLKDRCREAGIGHCSAHGVRKAAASIAQEYGATSGQLDAMFTWSDPDQRATYTKGASNLKLATDGFRILENALAELGVIGHSGNDVAPPTAGVTGVGQERPAKPLKSHG